MKVKDKIITLILCGIVICIYLLVNSYNHMDTNIVKLYNVYLDGELIGAIDDKEALYDLIDKKQQDIKDKYNVTNVYPPKGLEIVENYSYTTEVSELNSIYSEIEKLQDFTILGYEIKISNADKNTEFTINVLDKEVFNTAIENFIFAFVDKEDYNNYINGTQKDLKEAGLNYMNMGFAEDITIKQTYISVNDKIYEDDNELTQHLLFGFEHKEQNYTVKEGDTIESVAEDFELNPQEILIANSKYSSKDSLLTIGDNLVIAYVIPELSFSYTINEMEEEEQDFDKEVIRDNTKPSSYSEITTPGVKGLYLITREYTVTNGNISSTVEITNTDVIREKVNQVTTKGKKAVTYIWQTFEDVGSGWAWPVIDRYVITSPFGYRELGGGKMHKGIDISGTPWGAKIIAANDGVVTYVYEGCPNNGYYGNTCGGEFGNQVVISHGDNIYTIYAHMMNNVVVSVGQTVKRGQLIGYMANSGSSTGTHLHFGVSIGDPKSGGTFYNPRKLYQ